MLKTGFKIFFIVLAVTSIVLGYFYFFDRHKVVPNPAEIFSKSGGLLLINKPDELELALQTEPIHAIVSQKDSTYFDAAKFVNAANKEQQLKSIHVALETISDTLRPIFVFESFSINLSGVLYNWSKQYLNNRYKVVEKTSDVDYAIAYSEGAPYFYFSEIDGLFLLAFGKDELLQAVEQVREFVSLGKMHKLIKTAGTNSVATLFLRPTHLLDHFKTILKNNTTDSLYLSDILVFDLYFRDNNLMLSGMSDVSSNSVSQQLANTEGSNFSLPGVIPEKSGFIYHVSFASYFEQINIPQKDKDYLEWLNKWSDNEAVVFVTDGEPCVAVKVKGKSVARQSLENYSKQFGSASKTVQYKFDNSTTFDIKQSNFNWIAYLIPGEIDVKSPFKYGSVIDEYVVFGNNIDIMKSICRNTVLQQNMKATYQFQEHASLLSSRSGRFIYSDFNQKSLRYYFSESVTNFLQSVGMFDLFHTVAWQSTGSGEHIYNHIVLYRSEHEISKSNVRWKTKLKSSASLKPVVVKNHDTGREEIIVQDEKDFLYLINAKGRILWEKLLDGPIMSQIVQVDKYKNGNLQYLFNTAGKIYLVDRNGNDVERFPVKLSVKASAGLSVFDYDNSRNYRVFIPLEDRRVRLYDIDANIVSGWDFTKADAVVKTPVQHFRFDGKDFIVFADSLRHYILNRQGQHRVKPELLLGKAAQNEVFFDSRKARWVSSTPNGKLLYIDLAGDVQQKVIDTLSAAHYFLFADLDRDGHKDYIFIDGNKLKVFGSNHKLMFSYTFRNAIQEPPAYYLFSRHKAGLGIVDKVAGKVYMFGHNGKQFAGYPYPGITPFTISLMRGVSGFQLIVGNFDGFLYNYQLN
jgi:hypothetical protein